MADEFELWHLLNNALEQGRRAAQCRVDRLSSWRNGDTLKDHTVRAALLHPMVDAMAEKAVQMSREDPNDEAVEKYVAQLFADEKRP